MKSTDEKQGNENSDFGEHPKGPLVVLVRRKAASWIGIMPDTIQANDFICTFQDCDTVAVVRSVGGGHCKIIGTGLLILCVGQESVVLGQGDSSGIELEEEVAFHLDIDTLRLLSK